MLGHHWEKAEATVVARTLQAQHAGRVPGHDFVVDVRLGNGSTVRLTIHDGPEGDIPDPSAGDVVGVLYDPKHQHVKWDYSDPWFMDSAANQGAAGNALNLGFTGPGMTGSGGVQYLSGAAASEMLGSLFGPGGAEAIAAMRARAAEGTVPVADPADRLAKLQALRDRGFLNEAEYEAQRSKIIGAL